MRHLLAFAMRKAVQSRCSATTLYGFTFRTHSGRPGGLIRTSGLPDKNPVSPGSTASVALRCCCPAATRDNVGSAMLFPQHQGANDAVGGLRPGSIRGPTMRLAVGNMGPLSGARSSGRPDRASGAAASSSGRGAPGLRCERALRRTSAVYSIGEPPMLCPGAPATTTLAPRCCPCSIAEPALLSRLAGQRHQRGQRCCCARRDALIARCRTTGITWA
jgi:hypothetical protein